MQPQLTLVEYPGFFEESSFDEEKLLNTLTYLPAKLGNSQTRSETMLLNFRPDDKFHQPIQGTIFNDCKRVLVKLKITRSAQTDSSLRNALKIELSEVIGPIKKTVRFKKLSPYQFEVSIPDEWASLDDSLKTLDMDSIDEYAQKFVAEDEASEFRSFYPFPPPISTHFDFPMSILGPDMSLTSTRQPKTRKATEAKPRLPWQASFHDIELPGAPSPEALSLLPRLNTTTAALLKDIFEKRPIVSRLYASCESGIDYYDLRKVLPVFGFCFVDGPWLNCWVRYGLDPRTDSRYRNYQMIQCRNNFVSEGLLDGSSEPSKLPVYIFSGDASNRAFSQYQFCDIQYEPLLRIVNDALSVQETCSKSNGWYPPRTIIKMRAIMRQRWIEVLKQTNPEAWQRHAGQKKKKDENSTHVEQETVEDEEEGEDENEVIEDEEEDYDFYDED